MEQRGALELKLSVSDAIGTQAWWEWDDFANAEGLLRACTETALLDVALEAPEGQSAPFQTQATDIASDVLAQL